MSWGLASAPAWVQDLGDLELGPAIWVQCSRGSASGVYVGFQLSVCSVAARGPRLLDSFGTVPSTWTVAIEMGARRSRMLVETDHGRGGLASCGSLSPLEWPQAIVTGRTSVHYEEDASNMPTSA